MDPIPAVEILQLTRAYGSMLALNSLSLTINQGDLFGFIGSNGAGKTTTLRILATFLAPSSGTAKVLGHDVVDDANAVRHVIGYMPDFFGVYKDMEVTEYLDFFGACYKIPTAQREKTVNDVLELVGLSEKRGAIIGALSRGMQQRLGLARVLIHDPKVLLLDEPASGLDPRARIEMMAILEELQRLGKTIIISSHILSELQTLCNRVAIIEKGKLIYSGPVQGVRDQMSAGLVLLAKSARREQRGNCAFKNSSRDFRRRPSGWPNQSHLCPSGHRPKFSARIPRPKRHQIHRPVGRRGGPGRSVSARHPWRNTMTWALSIFRFFSGVWPVVQRELRARARKPRYYWMRVLAGAAALLVVDRMLENQFGPPSTFSTLAFVFLNMLLLALIVVAVPAMTSDCLAREKREGTLGLLFLTPLTPTGIVIGKCVTHALLAWSLWLSVLPAMFIPFLLGGLIWQNLVAAAAFQFCAVVVSVAAGLLASSSTKSRNLALFNAAALTFFFSSLILLMLQRLAPSPGAAKSSLWDSITEGFSLMMQLQMGGTQWFSPRPTPLLLAPPSSPLWVRPVVLACCLAIAILIVAIGIAAFHIRRTWGDKPPTVRQRWWTQRFCTVLSRNSFRHKMQHSLDTNPIEWLQQYSWKARSMKWGLCLLFLVIQLYALSPVSKTGVDALMETQVYLLLALAVVCTVAGVGSFRSEKESGALELILITPLSVNQIILGRAVGLWKQFLPAALMLAFFSIVAWWLSLDIFGTLPSSQSNLTDIFTIYWLAAIAFFSLPFFAVYAALRIKYFIGAVVLTWIGIGLEFAFGASLASLLNNSSSTSVLFCTTLFSLAFVKLTFFLLGHSLSRRIYSF